MSNRQYDAWIRRRTQKETFEVNPKIEQALRKTLQNPEIINETKKVARRGLVIALASTLLVFAVALAIGNIKPNDDVAMLAQTKTNEQITTTTSVPSNTTPYYDPGFSEVSGVWRTRMGIIYANHRLQINYEVTNTSSKTQDVVISPVWYDEQETLQDKHNVTAPTDTWSGTIAPQEAAVGTFIIYMLDPAQQNGSFTTGVQTVYDNGESTTADTFDMAYDKQTQAGEECFTVNSSFSSLTYQLVGSNYEYLSNGMMYMRVEYRADQQATLERLKQLRPDQTVTFAFAKDDGHHVFYVIEDEPYQATDGTWRLPYTCMLSGVTADESVELYTTYTDPQSNQTIDGRTLGENFRFIPSELVNQTNGQSPSESGTSGNYANFTFVPSYSGNRLDVQLNIQTRTDEPVLIRCKPVIEDRDLTLVYLNFSDMLTTGGHGTAHGIWVRLGEGDKAPDCVYTYQIYRLCNGHMLYQEDNYLSNLNLDQADLQEYSAQQDRFQKAFNEGNVIAAGGTLTMPKALYSGDAETDEARVDEALQTYLDQGWMELVQEGGDIAAVQNTGLPAVMTRSTRPLSTVQGDGYTIRLMQADFLDLYAALQPWKSSAYVVIDILFDSYDAAEKLDQSKPDMTFLLYQDERTPIACDQQLSPTSGLEWQDMQGLWHRTYVNTMAGINQNQASMQSWLAIPATPNTSDATTASWTLYPEEALSVKLAQTEAEISTDSTLSMLKDYSVDYSLWKAQYHVTLQNPYPVEQYVVWQPLPDATLTPLEQVVSPVKGFLLGEGESVEDQALYYMFDNMEESATMGISVMSYTPWADIYSEPTLAAKGTAGYAQQQANFSQAFKDGKLLFAAGRLILPDDYQAEKPQTTPLAYNLKQGLLLAQTQEAQSETCVSAPLATIADLQGDPIAIQAGAGYTARVMQAQQLDTAPYVLVDLLFDNASSAQALDKARPQMAYRLQLPDRSIIDGTHNTLSTAGQDWTRIVNGQTEYHRLFVVMAAFTPDETAQVDHLLVVPYCTVTDESYPDDAFSFSLGA